MGQRRSCGAQRVDRRLGAVFRESTITRRGGLMFHQLLTPVGNSLGLSFPVAALPVLVVILLLGAFRRPAWQAALAGLTVALVVAVGPWQMPVPLAFGSVLNGATFA